MAEKFLCQAVDMTFFESAPFKYVAEVEFGVSAADVFASFENADTVEEHVDMFEEFFDDSDRGRFVD